MYCHLGDRRLGSTFSDLTKVAGSLLPAGGSDIVGGSGATVANAVIDNIYAKEQARVQKLMDDADAGIVKAGQFIDWGKWAVAGLAAAGVYYLVKRARRA